MSGGQQDRSGVHLDSSAGNDVANVLLGFGAASMTTIAGDLDIDGDNMTSAGAMTFTPVGLYTIAAPNISGPVFHLDANAATDNIVDIDAGQLDIDSAATTIDATGNIILTAGDDIKLETTTVDGEITLESAHVTGRAIHIDGNAHVGSIVDIDAGE